MVETTICHNELLALGDLEMNMLYRELLGTLPAMQAERLRSVQRVWLRKRNRDCLTSDAVDEVCIARLYSDRLAALAKLNDPSLGTAPRFDADYAIALVTRGIDLRQDAATRLAMYPLVMDPSGALSWQAADSGLLFEQTYVRTRIVWPADVNFRYSDMLFVGSNGMVWTVTHTETVEPVDMRIWWERDAGRAPLTVRSETGNEGDYPFLVEAWLKEHTIPDAAGKKSAN